MKQKILASEIVGIGDFPAAAAAHAVEMKNWRAHQRRVAEDEKNGVPKDQAHWPQKQPRAHPAVEKAVDEKDEANFEIVDDLPDPLIARKAALFGQVDRAQQAAIAAIVPPGKVLLYDIRERDILAADARLVTKLQDGNGGFVRKMLGNSLSSEAIQRAIVDARHPEDTKHLAVQAARRERIAQIERVAAKAHHDIEDLTAETIGDWKPPTF